MPPELRRAHQANDRAVMQAYGFGVKMTEAECVGELMGRYQSLELRCWGKASSGLRLSENDARQSQAGSFFALP